MNREYLGCFRVTLVVIDLVWYVEGAIACAVGTLQTPFSTDRAANNSITFPDISVASHPQLSSPQTPVVF